VPGVKARSDEGEGDRVGRLYLLHADPIPTCRLLLNRSGSARTTGQRNTKRPKGGHMNGAHIVMPAAAAIHDFAARINGKSWMPTFVDMMWNGERRVNLSAA
jgi:hypothetical protein